MHRVKTTTEAKKVGLRSRFPRSTGKVQRFQHGEWRYPTVGPKVKAGLVVAALLWSEVAGKVKEVKTAKCK